MTCSPIQPAKPALKPDNPNTYRQLYSLPMPILTTGQGHLKTPGVAPFNHFPTEQ
jgi:hypothetical protein